MLEQEMAAKSRVDSCVVCFLVSTSVFNLIQLYKEPAQR